MQNFSFLRGWVVFLSKKKTIFLCKTSVFAGLGGLFSTFFVYFLSFFLNVLPHPGGPASAAVAVPTAVNADSRCTLAGGWRSHESSSLFHRR